MFDLGIFKLLKKSIAENKWGAIMGRRVLGIGYWLNLFNKFAVFLTVAFY